MPAPSRLLPLSFVQATIGHVVTELEREERKGWPVRRPLAEPVARALESARRAYLGLTPHVSESKRIGAVKIGGAWWAVDGDKPALGPFDTESDAWEALSP